MTAAVQTPFSIAVSARLASSGAIFSLVFLAGCSVLPTPPERPVVYDFGPGTLAVAPAAAPADTAAKPAAHATAKPAAHKAKAAHKKHTVAHKKAAAAPAKKPA